MLCYDNVISYYITLYYIVLLPMHRRQAEARLRRLQVGFLSISRACFKCLEALSKCYGSEGTIHFNYRKGKTNSNITNKTIKRETQKQEAVKQHNKL